MSTREFNFWYRLARIIPRKLVYSCVIYAWSIATTGKHSDKIPTEVTVDMTLRCLGVE